MAPRVAESSELTPLIRRMQAGEEELAPRVFERIHAELRAIAGSQMAQERTGHTLQPTALVNEAYLRLMGNGPQEWANRAHFYKAAANAMRRILIDYARGKGRAKRGGGRVQLPLDVVDLATRENSEEIVSVDEAVCRLEKQDKRMAEIVKLRFYAGLSEKETAKALGISDRTVTREWKVARAFLQAELSG